MTITLTTLILLTIGNIIFMSRVHKRYDNDVRTKINEIINHLNSSRTLEEKQSTSLREVPLRDKIDFIQDRLLNDHVTTEESITEILQVFQSHLLKEIDENAGYYEMPLTKTGYLIRNDIIKIINNLTK